MLHALYEHQKTLAAHGIFRSFLGTSTPDGIFHKKQLTFSDDGKRLYEYSSNKNELAEAVLGIDFPRILNTVDVDHYTTVQSLRGIVMSEAVHLQAVARNLPFGEFTTFAHEHGLNGYFEADPTGQFYYEELSKDLFYVSLTEPNHPNEDEMWRVFGGAGTGVRLRLRVTPKPPSEVRRIGYHGNAPTTFKQINDMLNMRENLTYVPWGVSRICAFYLPLGFQYEREVRLLVKRHQGSVDRTKMRGAPVWPVALGTTASPADDPWCGIELSGIDVGSRGSRQAVEGVLAGSRYEGLPIR